jgi:uncharacterized heparinase superfamily protein
MDRFSGQPAKTDLHYSVRFHLHHAVGGSCHGAAQRHGPAAARWGNLAVRGQRAVDLEESVHLSDVFGSRPTHQLVLPREVDGGQPAKWRFSLLS